MIPTTDSVLNHFSVATVVMVVFKEHLMENSLSRSSTSRILSAFSYPTTSLEYSIQPSMDMIDGWLLSETQRSDCSSQVCKTEDLS